MTAYLLCALTGLLMGWFGRDVRDVLRNIQNRLNELKMRQEQPKKEEQKRASFAEPMTPLELAAMEERERIERLNA